MRDTPTPSFPWSESSGRYVEVGGTKMHLADLGAGPPVLLLHGWGRSYASWAPVAPALATRRRVLAPDLPGFGYSERPNPPAQRYTEVARLLVEFLDQEGIERASVVGNSYGAAVAMRMALNWPDRVDIMMLLAPLGYRTRLSRNVRAVGKRSLWGRLLWSQMTAQRLSKRLSKHLVNGTGHVGEELERELAGFGAGRGGAPGLVDALKASAEDLAWQVDEIEPPTLVVCGTSDTIVPAQLGSDLADAVQEGRFEGIFQAGHFPHEDSPEEFLDLATVFLAGRENRRGPDNFSLVVDNA
jgi:pimeloyl-ACP methyl ester carboxylesterase